MSKQSNESNITLALEALDINKKLSVLAAARIYGVSATTLRRRRDSITAQRDLPANLSKLTDLKAINEWFILIQNIKAKYGIIENSIFNFDEIGFMIGIIFPGIVVTIRKKRDTLK